jgi:hypothetical protein
LRHLCRARKNHSIRKVMRAGMVSTLAGALTNHGAANGVGADAQFNESTSLALNGSDNVHVAYSLNCPIRKISPAGVVTTIAFGTAGNLYASTENAVVKITL